ncbi:elongation factor P maturation arginine rhamnosyltransferase EarP, partial [Paraburkholderia dipogonis]|uniref:elongation factor P maturation arginine rhamnosyltransferase EarP n=1 Tax=Paraburkholderia dipogonis TaxID=1211383 RepID=UPI003620141F
ATSLGRSPPIHEYTLILSRTLPADARDALARFWHAWNGTGRPDWAQFQRYLPAFRQRAAAWAGELAQVGDLAGNLALFAKTQLK